MIDKASYELEIELKRDVFSKSYYEFFKWCFGILFPNEKYEDTFHVKYLCDLLQAEAERILRKEEKTKDIIINIPPRSSKSLITSVCLLPWVWINNPSAPFICVSFDEDLSNVNSRLSRDIIRSDEYQAMFGHIYKMRRDADGVEMYQNDKGGFRMSKTTGANITGHKGVFILCLDGKQKIMTDKGELSISEIVDNKLDVSVLSHNLYTDKNEYKGIISYQKNMGKVMVKIKTKNRELICTEDHLIWTENRGWTEAKDIRNDDEFLNDKLEFETFESIEFLNDIPEYTYNIEIESNHNYYVNGILTHNCDDVQNPKTAEQEIERKKTINYYTKSLFNRLTPINLGIRIIIMQRLHEEDLTGYLLKNNPEDYTHVCLPAQDQDNVKPSFLRQFYKGGLLDQIRLSSKILQTFRKVLGSRGYSGQYDQKPSPDDGGIIKKEWFDIVSPLTLKRDTINEPIHFFIDSAFTKKQENDPTAILACFKQGNYIYVLDVAEVWLEFPDLIKFIQEYVAKFQLSSGSKIFIEPKASGLSIVQTLRGLTKLNIVELASSDVDKVTRANAAAPTMEGKRVRLVEGSYIEDYLNQLAAFPNGAHDDKVDVTVYAVNTLLPAEENPDFLFLNM